MITDSGMSNLDQEGDDMKAIDRGTIKEDMDRFYGRGKFSGDMANLCFQDYVYKNSLEERYGLTFEELKQIYNGGGIKQKDRKKYT